MSIPVHIDVVLKDPSANVEFVENLVREMLTFTIIQYEPGEIEYDRVKFQELDRLVQKVKIVDLYLDVPMYNDYLPYSLGDPIFHIYSLKSAVQGEAEEEYIQSGAGDGEYTSAALSYPLPSVVFDGMWESIVSASLIKQHLLGAAETAINLALRGIDDNAVSYNRLILLYGPPGCGKSSLAMSLAQRLAIRLSNEFSSSRLLVINSHSLFSRYYSESGKLVSAMFKSVRDTALDNPNEFIVIVIDEVESLSASRDKAIGSGDPSDSIRVVNALLTQIDSLKHVRNIMILSTSNLLDSVDSAFLDRADIKMEVPLPPVKARFNILKEGVMELMSKGLLGMDNYNYPDNLRDILEYMKKFTIIVNTNLNRDIDSVSNEKKEEELIFAVFPGPEEDMELDEALKQQELIKSYGIACVLLAKMAQRAKGFSGRTMRKLAFVSLARIWELSKQNMKISTGAAPILLISDFIPSLTLSIDEEIKNREIFK